MTRVVHEDFDLLTPKDFKTQTFWTDRVWLTDYHVVTKKKFTRSFSEISDCFPIFLMGDIGIMKLSPKTEIFVVEIKVFDFSRFGQKTTSHESLWMKQNS